MIIYQASFNPYDEEMSGFIFFNQAGPGKPMDVKSLGKVFETDTCIHRTQSPQINLFSQFPT